MRVMDVFIHPIMGHTKIEVAVTKAPAVRWGGPGCYAKQRQPKQLTIYTIHPQASNQPTNGTKQRAREERRGSTALFIIFLNFFCIQPCIAFLNYLITVAN